jgi:hypothetical protein
MNRLAVWLVYLVCLQLIVGCASYGQPLDIDQDNYRRVPFGSLLDLQKDQLVVLQQGEREVMGVIAKVERDWPELTVDRLNGSTSYRVERIKIWIFSGDEMTWTILRPEGLDRISLLVPD